MKQLLLLIVVIASFPVPAFADDDYVFRKVKWGMTIEEVKKSEGLQKDSKYSGGVKPSAVTNNCYTNTYRADMFGVKTDITYAFPEETSRLAAISIIIPSHCLGSKTVNKCLDGINEMLTKKYGEPSISGEQYMDDEQDFAKMSFKSMSIWIVKDKVIFSQIASLYINDKDVVSNQVMLLYMSPEYAAKTMQPSPGTSRTNKTDIDNL